MTWIVNSMNSLFSDLGKAGYCFVDIEWTLRSVFGGSGNEKVVPLKHVDF